MAVTIKHAKTDTIADWTQADLDAQIALGNFPPGTLLSDIVLPSDWNDDHTFTGTLPIANGGTGQTTANAALNALLPSQSSQSGKVLSTDGTNTSWIAAGGTGTVTSVTGTAPVSVATGTTTPVISMPAATSSVDGYLTSTDWNTFNNKGSGTVTSVSVASANGFAGTSSGGATPSLTLSTSVTGLLKGNGTAISAATSGTDYAPATSGTSILYGNGSGGFSNVTIGTNLTFTGGTLSATGGGGSGDVVGPASATDNAITRFDGTTGKLIQNSTVTLSDTGALSGVTSIVTPDYITYDTTATGVTVTPGLTTWNDGEGTLDLGLKGGNVTLNIGNQEYARVYNDQGSTITKGQVVYISGAQGNRVAVKLARANLEATSFGTLGIVAETITNGSEGWIIVSGALGKLNTTGLTAGSTVYLSPSTAGAITTTKPQAPDQLVVLGWVERVDNIVGSIYVKIDNGYELDELHDVQITSPTSGNMLIYDASTSPIGVWKNANLTAGTGISITNGAGSVTVTNSAPDQTVAISGTSPVSVTGTYPNFTVSMTQSSGSTNGWLSSTDWTTFNSKQQAFTNLSTIGSLANGVGWLYNNGSGTFSYSTPTAANVGAVPTTRTITINGTSFDLSANRTWSVGTVTSVAALTLGTTGTDLSSTVATGTTTPVITLNVPTASATNRGALSAADWTTFNNKGNGTVTSVTWTGGIVSVATGTTTPAFTIAGTSGGIPYFSSASTWTSSGVLAANSLVIGGGAGLAPSTITTGTGVVTALGVNTGTAGSFVVNGGALGTPASGTVTNLTGTASININGTVGATTANTGAFTTLSASGVATFSAGTVSAPAITTTGDPNTGIFFPAADTIAFTEGGVEAMRIDSSGNVRVEKAARGTVLTDNDLSFDMNASSNFKCTPTALGTLTFTNITSGQSGFILLVNTGGYAISAAATTEVSATTLTTISTAGTYLLSYFSDGTNVFVTNSGALA